MDAGRAAEVAQSVRDSICSKAKTADGKHDWEVHFPGSPSSWGQCRNCNVVYFNK